eukprot:1145792-Pelagomonas_calceolata.AAC.4
MLRNVRMSLKHRLLVGGRCFITALSASWRQVTISAVLLCDQSKGGKLVFLGSPIATSYIMVCALACYELVCKVSAYEIWTYTLSASASSSAGA